MARAKTEQSRLSVEKNETARALRKDPDANSGSVYRFKTRAHTMLTDTVHKIKHSMHNSTQDVGRISKALRERESTRRNSFSSDLDFDGEENSQEKHRWLFTPTKKRWWDLLLVITIMYNSIKLPFDVSFKVLHLWGYRSKSRF